MWSKYASILVTAVCGVQIIKIIDTRTVSRGVISTFSWGVKFFFIFQCHRTIEKLEKKQHFICSNLTLFMFPSFFFLFFLFSFFFFLSFLLFYFSLGGDGPPAPPPQMTPLTVRNLQNKIKYWVEIIFKIFKRAGWIFNRGCTCAVWRADGKDPPTNA